MPSPSAASENVVSAVHCQCPCTSNIKLTPRRLDTCLIQCVSHAAVKRCSALVSAYNTTVHQGNKTMHGARRPTAHPLYPGRCVSYNIAIWNATIYRLACWATIWSLVTQLYITWEHRMHTTQTFKKLWKKNSQPGMTVDSYCMHGYKQMFS